jgi:hypothetical protein
MKGYVFQNKRGDRVAPFTYTDQNERRRYVKRRATVNTEAGAKQSLLEIVDEFDNSAGPKITSLSQLCDYYEKHYCVAVEFVDGQQIVGLKDYKKVKGQQFSGWNKPNQGNDLGVFDTGFEGCS